MFSLLRTAAAVGGVSRTLAVTGAPGVLMHRYAAKMGMITPVDAWSRHGNLAVETMFENSPPKHRAQSADENMRSDVISYVNEALELGNPFHHRDFEKNFGDLVNETEAVLTVRFPVHDKTKEDDHDYDIVSAVRVHHLRHRSPVFGGVRFDKTTTLDHYQALAQLNSLKCALTDIPFGGAAGGVAISNKGMTDVDLEKVTRRYAFELIKKNVLGPATDVLCADYGTSAKHMAWVKDTYEAFEPEAINTLGTATGKPLEAGGIRGFLKGWGHGVACGIENVMNDVEELTHYNKCGVTNGLAGKRVVVQGLGSNGSYAAHFLARKGAKVIAVTGSRHYGAYDPDGLDVEDVVAYRTQHNKSVKGYPKAETITEAEALALDCDVLVLTWMEGGIHGGNADTIKAKVIAEANNWAITRAGEEKLEEQGKMVIPDVYLCSAHPIVGYFEWLKNLSHVRMGRLSKRHEMHARQSIVDALEKMTGKKVSPERRDELLGAVTEEDMVISAQEDAMADSWQAVKLNSMANKVDIRLAAYNIALGKMEDSIMRAGMFPN